MSKNISEFKFSEDTLVPVSFIITICTFIFAFSHVYEGMKQNQKNIANLDNDRRQLDVRIFDQLQGLTIDVREVSEKTHNIEGKLDLIIMQLSDKNRR